MARRKWWDHWFIVKSKNTMLKLLYYTLTHTQCVCVCVCVYQKTWIRIIYYSCAFWSSLFGYILIEPYASFDHSFFFFLISNKNILKRRGESLEYTGSIHQGQIQIKCIKYKSPWNHRLKKKNESQTLKAHEDYTKCFFIIFYY